MCKKRILIVDDDDSILQLLEEGIIYFCEDCQVTLANNGQVALSLLKSQQFDLILTDYDMPGLNGLELAQAAHQVWPKARIVLMSGQWVPNEPQGQDPALGVESFLQKPFSLAQLAQLV